MDRIKTQEFLIAVLGIIGLAAVAAYEYYQYKKARQAVPQPITTDLPTQQQLLAQQAASTKLAQQQTQTQLAASAPAPLPTVISPPTPISISAPANVYGQIPFGVEVTGIPTHGFLRYYVTNPQGKVIEDTTYASDDLRSFNGAHTFVEQLTPGGADTPYGSYWFRASYRASTYDPWATVGVQVNFGPVSQSGEGQPQVISKCSHYEYLNEEGQVIGTGTSPTYNGPTLINALTGEPEKIVAKCWY